MVEFIQPEPSRPRLHRVIDRAPSGRVATEGVAFPEDRREVLRRALEARIQGEVRFSDGDRALYANDA